MIMQSHRKSDRQLPAAPLGAVQVNCRQVESHTVSVRAGALPPASRHANDGDRARAPTSTGIAGSVSAIGMYACP